MPAVGAKLDLPRIELLDGSVYQPAACSRHRQAAAGVLVVEHMSVFAPCKAPAWKSFGCRSTRAACKSWPCRWTRRRRTLRLTWPKKGHSFPAAWTSPEWRKAFPKPKGLPITLLSGRDGRLLLAERGQMFAEDVEAIAQLI